MQGYEEILGEYIRDYDLGNATPNDRNNLDILINNQLLIRTMQARIGKLVEEGNVTEEAINIKKLQDSLRDLIEQSLAVERALGIDRKSRKRDDQQDVAGYIQMIKSAASEWLEKQLIYVYCPACRVMVGRILPAHEHTEFDIGFQCSQCNKMITSRRKEKSIFFDVKGRKEWREKYPIEIVQPSSKQEFDDDQLLENELDVTAET